MTQLRTNSLAPTTLNVCDAYNKDGNCVQCQNTYILLKTKEGNTFCTSKIDGCSVYGYSGECVQCDSGRSIQYNVSLSNVCKCSPGTFNDGNRCLIPDQVKTGCAELESFTSCKTCKDGFYKNLEGSPKNLYYSCIPCSRLFGDKCKKCEMGKKGMVNCIA